MTKEEQKQFIEDVCNTLKNSMLEKLDDIPSNWDGKHLRHYLKEKASEFVWSDMKKPKGYNNDIIINNL